MARRPSVVAAVQPANGNDHPMGAQRAHGGARRTRTDRAEPNGQKVNEIPAPSVMYDSVTEPAEPPVVRSRVSVR